MKRLTKVIVWVLMLLVLPVWAYAKEELPDELTVNVGDVENVGTNVTVVLRKHSIRSADYQCWLWTDAGYKKLAPFPVSTYRGHVKDDPCMYVNGNIEPDGIINLNFTENRLIIGRVRGLKIEVPKAKCTATMSAGHKVVSLQKLPQRQVPTPGGYVIPEVPMRLSKWSIHIAKTYTEQFELEKVVSQVEQRWNDGDFIFARDVGTAWEIETVVMIDPKSTKPQGDKSVSSVGPENRPGRQGGGVSGVNVGKNHGKFNSLWLTGIHHDANVLLHEAAHLYDNWCHQLDVNDGLCGCGAYWAYNNVAFLVDERKARYNETNFPGVIYGTPLPPHAMYDFANTQKDKPVTIDVLENDYDGNGDVLSLQAVVPQSEQGGTCALSEDGKKVVYTPAQGFVGADRFTYTVVDSTGLGNRSGQVKVDVRTEGLAIHYDFEQVEAEPLAERARKDPLSSEVWFWQRYDQRPIEEKTLYHPLNQGPYNVGNGVAEWVIFGSRPPLQLAGAEAGGRGTTYWMDYYDVKGVRGKGMWNTGQQRAATVKLGEGGDPGRESLSASLWVLFPAKARGVLLCKGGVPFDFVNGWAISGGTGGGFKFSGNVTRMRKSELFSLTSEQTAESNTWYHLVMVMDREKKQLRAWVNNKEVTKGEKDNPRIPDGVIECYGPLQLFNAYTGKWWQGAKNVLADEVKIFTSVLTPKQVAELYAEGKDAKVPKFPKLPDPEPKK